MGAKAILRFQISQHSRDAELLKSLIKYLECGHYYSYGEESIFVVESFSEIREKILPFFDKYPIIGVKSLDLADFNKLVILMKDKGHLTESGLEELRLIKAGMNSGRES